MGQAEAFLRWPGEQLINLLPGQYAFNPLFDDVIENIFEVDIVGEPNPALELFEQELNSELNVSSGINTVSEQGGKLFEGVD